MEMAQQRRGTSRTTRTTRSLMAAASDSDRAMGRVSPHAYFSGRVSPPSSNVLTKAHILDAIARSNDDGCTLDLSNKNLVDVGESGAEELAQVGKGDDLLDDCRILRIALVGNYLSSLPMSFARLTRLRYLTLRSNNFSVFPEVLTTMPSLEILDFSRNKIRGLPTNPGTLVNLRVMSISRNKVRRLPSYLWKFKDLTVVKADHNPIEWPPQEVMEPEEDLEDGDVMHRWVESLKSWIKENTSDDERVLTPPSEPQAEDLPAAEISEHSRSASIESTRSIYSTTSFDDSVKGSKSHSPSTIDTADISPSIAEGISTSPESYLPTPEDSLPSVDDDTARPNHNAHGRNKSYASSNETRTRSLSVQKSLPDLRQAKGRGPVASRIRTRTPSIEALKKVPNETFSSMGESSTSGLETTSRPRPPRGPRHEPLPSISERKPPSMDFERNSYFRRLSTLPSSTISRTTPPAILTVVDAARSILFAVTQVYQSLQHYTVHCIDDRLAAVLMKVLDPASSCLMQLINALDNFDARSRRGCPPPSVCRSVIESCRDNVAMFGKAVGVLAMQLKVLASRDDVRYSRQMLLVIYGATAEISNSWQGIAPQLDSIEPLLRDDRPSPLSNTGMTTPAPTPPRAPPHKSQLASQAPSRVLIPPIAEQPEPPLAPEPPGFTRPAGLARTHSAQPDLQHQSSTIPMKRPTQSEGRSRMSRRHAGSFSVEDLEIGRSLPSNTELSPPARGVASGSSTPTPRPHTASLRNMPSTGSPIPPLPNHSPIPPQPSPDLHSRQNSAQNSAANTPQLLSSGLPRGVTDASVNSNALVDKEAIEAMAAAVQAAPAVWSILEEISNEMTGMPVDVHSSLMKAQAVTRRLSDNIRAIQEGHLNADRKALREDAHVFIKTVITLSKLAKDYYTAHGLSGQLRGDIAKLTNATQSFVMLLHVSSFAPSTPRPYSPMVERNQNQNVNGSGVGNSATSQQSQQSPVVGGLTVTTVPEERPQLGVPGAGLGRSRSAQPSASSKLVPSSSQNPAPRSAQPHQQNFKVPTTPRPNGTSKLRNGEAVSTTTTIITTTTEGGLSVDGHSQVNGS
ncbi:uncharacterized protein FOMMEDRAFT_168845 [Fomitiporia mediterranea MF3/22]|uniref:uncharacterized protein n=1 Tax=Fomitiporia mediterranea (strain MF3/22) TaxID=694068 RepID=UPI0004407859|nr:uncharacterized protein FOMMEDRAFT_168845 [Fomitiporia mediterranea MF3/22]EJD02375.1 hypothetical protein FOMMEDRAFT_168845 [Fomitiporia mediterranea MF3/22]